MADLQAGLVCLSLVDEQVSHQFTARVVKDVLRLVVATSTFLMVDLHHVSHMLASFTAFRSQQQSHE